VLLPTEIPVMTLPNATLFPQALLPLYVFEPRYRQMLADVLQTNRMFSVAMQKPGCLREVPAPVAGLGVVGVSVGHRDGTSHVILQGIIRVELQETLRYKPYRVQRIRVLETPPADNVTLDALVEKVHELLTQRLASSLPVLPFPTMAPKETDEESPCQCSEAVARDVLEHAVALRNPEHIADLVSYAVLRCPVRRQVMLETTDITARLRQLILFLGEETKEHRSDEP
jgi:ATP-dependent Lon protease